jgi:hypothetical protein
MSLSLSLSIHLLYTYIQFPSPHSLPTPNPLIIRLYSLCCIISFVSRVNFLEDKHWFFGLQTREVVNKSDGLYQVMRWFIERKGMMIL